MNELSVPDAEITPPRNGAVSLPLPPARPKLAAALAKAQQAVKRVPHDARNDWHKYDYTSAESVIAAGKDALAGCGLALLPVRQALNGWERQGENRFELERHFLLLHESGESSPIVVNWPVCPEKGRPLDKATAAAATISLSYLLRDLLLMPRVDPADEVAGRDDRPAAAPAPATEAAKKPKKPKTLPEPTNGAELVPWLGRCDDLGATAGRWKRDELTETVYAQMLKKGAGKEMPAWDHQTTLLAIEEAKVFGHDHPSPAAKAG